MGSRPRLRGGLFLILVLYLKAADRWECPNGRGGESELSQCRILNRESKAKFAQQPFLAWPVGWWPRDYFKIFGIDFQHKYRTRSGFPMSAVKFKGYSTKPAFHKALQTLHNCLCQSLPPPLPPAYYIPLRSLRHPLAFGLKSLLQLWHLHSKIMELLRGLQCNNLHCWSRFGASRAFCCVSS